ncbi:hypothetical protein [Streptomyces globisporus]|uniref:hypothetical protein n=1 Tax=Streptomyces globisporus TaxID=1908 RepID=UPI0036783E4B
MAVAGSGRGPIKVGSGYIDVFPRLNQQKLKETRSQIERQMGASGKAAGKTFSNGVIAQVATIPKKAKEAAQKAQKEIQKSSLDSKKVLNRIEREITRDYGREAGKRFRQAVDLETKKKKLLDQTSAATRRAAQATVKEEQAAARTQARAWENAERERIRFIRDRRLAAERATRDEAAAHRRAHLQMREDIRRTLTEARSARLADLRGQMDVHRDQLAALRTQLTDYRRQMQDHTRAVGRSLTGIQTSWRRQGEAIERVGTNAVETGRLISANLLTPLAGVAAALTTIGVKSADMRILGQMGLSAAGVSKKNSAQQMKDIQKYAIDTPFSIETMHEYQMKLIRSIAGNDNEWYKKATKTAAADRAADKTTDIIKAIGDTMARAGNLDPEMFKRAMYAVDRIMDMDKAPTRNINQLVQATGIPAGELARMFGFKTAGEFWKKVGTPVAKGGGISGQDMIDNLLQEWDPRYFLLGKDGKRRKDPRTGQPIVNPNDHSTAGGSAGYGEKMTSATISGRVSQLKERAQFELGSLFAKENTKTGEYEYTDLGEAIMGRATGKDKSGNVIYEGGLLQQIQQLGGGQKENVVKLLETFFSTLSTFTEQIQWFSDWLDAHPQVKDVFANLLKVAAVALPFILAMGLMTKVLGKTAKIMGAGLSPLASAGRGARGGGRTALQVRDGLRSRREGGSFRQGYQDSRSQRRDGDVRGPVARMRGRITGRDSGADGLRNQMRETEDAISETEAAIRRLQREVRNVNSVSVRQLVDQFAGSGNGSLQGAASSTGSRVNNVTTQVNQLNRASLGTVGGEVNSLQEKSKSLNKALKKSVELATELNGKNFNGLKLAVDSAHGTVTDLKNKIDDTASSVGSLNRRKLDNLQDEFKQGTSAARSFQDRIQATIRSVGNLNGAKLGGLKKEFGSLRTAVNSVHTLVGTSKSGLHGRVVNLDNRSLSKVTKAVKDLKSELDNAGKKAGTLDSRLNDIGKKAPGGSSGGSGKKTKRATGGVLPGYTPGMDVHVFQSPTGGELHLSGGESVMRPEFTSVLGEAEVNRINAAARVGGVDGVRKAMKFAKGGVLDRLGLGGIDDAMRTFNMGPNILGATGAASLYSASDPLGGQTRKGIQGGGKPGSLFNGKDVGGKFKGQYDFMTRDVFDLLKKAKVPSGWSQAVGIVGGALSPVSAEYFWNDVWKGQGNVLERGQTYLGHMFSPKTLQKIVSNLFGGGWDSLKGLWETGKRMVTDPVGMVKDTINGVWEVSRNSYNGFVDNVSGLREIIQNPMAYGSQVAGEVYETAKENLPNLNKLFDFSGSGLSSSPPDMSKLLESGGFGTTKALSWARTQHGLPYQWGGNGNPSWDCSGFMSAIESVIRGQKPHRRWATGSFHGSTAPDGWVKGLTAPFMIGITNAGVGHTAGTINGVNVESRGGDGVIVGPGARSFSSSLFTDVYGFRPSITKGYASGTDGADRGWAWVGEEGPELVNFKGGETVLNARDSLIAGRNVERGYASGTKDSGLYKGMVGSTSQLNTALGKLRDLLTKAFSADLISKSKHGSLSKWLQKENGTLTAAAKKRATIAQAIKDANAKIADIKKQKAEMASDISSEASGKTPLLEAFNSGGGVSASGALAGLKDRLKRINDFKANLTALRKKGYGNAIIDEVARAGIDQGNEMAKALMGASTSEAADLKKTYSEVFKASDSLGNSVAGEFFKAGEDSANALLKGLQNREKQVLKGITSLVEKALKKVRKELGVGKSTPVPSDIAAILSWLTGVSQPAKKKSSKKKGYWTGTLSASPGLALVGERGPELVDFKGGGARVFNSGETASMLSNSSRPIQITIYEAKSENTTDAVVRAFGYLDSMYGNRL